MQVVDRAAQFVLMLDANRPHFISPTSMPSLGPTGAPRIDLLKSEKKTKKNEKKKRI
jgi:hypothetical protein